MQEEFKFVRIGSVASCNGRDGQLDLVLSREIELTKEPVFIYIDGLPVPFFIESATRKKNCKWYVKFVDVDSMADAEELVGKEVFLDADAECCIKAEISEDFGGLVGWEVWTNNNKIGEITDFIDIPANPCIELNGETLIPLAEDFILEIDEASSRLYMTLPKGLV